MNVYVIELETMNVFNTNVNKIIMFKSSSHAYEYALKLEPLIKRDKINSLDEAIKSKVIWESNRHNFPRYRCKMTSIDNDVIIGLHNYDKEKENYRHMIQNIYKNLKINDLI
jgi:hypothetical protein